MEKKLPAPNAIPILNQPAITLGFGKMDSDYTVVDHTLQVANQDTLSGAVYEQLRMISSIELNMTKPHFIKVWKQILLKRAQDLYEMEKQVKPEHRLDINPTNVVPAPLADISTALGSFQSAVTGHDHHIIPPAFAENDDLWDIDDELFNDWQILCSRIQHHYKMKIPPAEFESDHRPIALTYVAETRAAVQHIRPRMIRIKAYTNEPTPTDALLRSVNDDLFIEEDEWSYNHAHLFMSPEFNQLQVVNTYVGSYVLDSNA